MLVRPDANCLRPRTPGDALMGAAARNGRLSLPAGVSAWRRGRFGMRWHEATDGRLLSAGDRVLVRAVGGPPDFRDREANGHATHRPWRALTLPGKVLVIVSRASTGLAACGLAALILFAHADATYPLGDGIDRSHAYHHEVWRRAREAIAKGGIEFRRETAAQRDRLDAARGAVGLPPTGTPPP